MDASPIISAAVEPSSPRTRVVLDRPLDSFQQLTAGQRRRLLVRVLCELVAYDEPDLATDERLAG